jgi:hypothetical protein
MRYMRYFCLNQTKKRAHLEMLAMIGKRADYALILLVQSGHAPSSGNVSK